MEKEKKKRTLEELNLIDDFLFCEASADKTMAYDMIKLIIERTLGIKLEHCEIELQKTINGLDTDCHGVRLDLFVSEQAEGNGKVVRLFDIEPNNITKVNLPKRSRYYQALTDVKLLETGVDYDKLPELWSIWILSYDPFKENHMIYSVKNVVEGLEKVEYNDGIRKLFLYTDGKIGGTKELKDLLQYMKDSRKEKAVDEELQKLHANVERLKHRKEIGVKYMQVQEMLKYVADDAREEGRKAGLEEGREEGRKAGLEEGREEGQEAMLFMLLKKGTISVEEAVGNSNLSLEEIQERLKIMEN